MSGYITEYVVNTKRMHLQEPNSIQIILMQQIRVGQQKKALFLVYDDFSLKVQIKFSTTQVISNCFAKKKVILKSL